MKNNSDFKSPISIGSLFYREEIKRIVLCGILMLLPLGYLVFCAEQPIYILLISPIVVLIALIIMLLVGKRKFNKAVSTLGEYQKERIEEEFMQSHCVYKLFSGEVHLLEDYLVCRSNGRLFLIDIEDIESVRTIKTSQTYGLVNTLIIKTNKDKSFKLEFAGTNQKNSLEVIEWITQKNNTVKLA